jgi:latrophilin 2
MFFTDGSWRLYVDGGRLTLKGRAARADHPIPGGGDLVLGQSSRSPYNGHSFDLQYAFIGDIAFANIWSRVMLRSEVKDLRNDCVMLQCGDVVEWADFRSGTRGDMKIRWPSRIFSKLVVFVCRPCV